MALFGRTPQNAQGGGTKRDKTKVKPESQGGLTFEQLLKQEKGNRDQAAKRFNAQGGGKHTSSAYSPKKQAAKGGGGGGGGGKAKATPARAPVPTPRPAPDPTQTFAPGGSTMVPMPEMPDTSVLQGVPPELIAPPQQAFAPGGSTQVPMPEMYPGPQGLPPELGGPGNAINPTMPMPPFSQLPPGLPAELQSADAARNALAGALPKKPGGSGGGPFGYGGSIFGPNGWWPMS